MPQNKLKALLMESHWRIIMLIEHVEIVERSHLLVLLWKMVSMSLRQMSGSVLVASPSMLVEPTKYL